MRNGIYGFVFAAVSSFAFAATPACAEDAKSVEVSVKWKLTIEPDGSVSGLDPLGKVAASIREPVEKAIQAWHFKPANANGKPARTQTWLFAQLRLDPLGGDNYRISVAHAETGALLTTASSPRFPGEAVKAGEQGMFAVRIDVDAAGHSTASVIAKAGPNPGRRLERAVISSAQKWPVELERVDGQPMPASLVMSTCFFTSGVGSRTPPSWCDWRAPGGATVLAQGEAVTLNSVAKLETDVAGHAL